MILPKYATTSGYNPSTTSNPPDIIQHLIVDLSLPQRCHINGPQEQHKDNPRTHMITRSKLKNDPSLKSKIITFSTPRGNIREPKGYLTTLKIPHWLKAMQEDIKALTHNHTWDLVPRPSTANVVGSKWVFKTKLNANRIVERYKARLVAQGFFQIPNLDFGETFSLVIKQTAIRLILSLSMTMGWTMRQLDVKNALLHGFLKEKVFMEQPLRFINHDLPDYVCRLNRSLYGLKQALRSWFDRLSQFLLHSDFCCGKANSSLFILHKGHYIILLLIYVDDIIITGNDNKIIGNLINTLSEEFSLKDLGPLHCFLGLEVKYIRDGLFVS